MSRSSKLKSFMNTTGSSRETALNYLNQSLWKLDAAVDRFYQTLDENHSQSSSSSRNETDLDAINAWFEEYAGDGILNFCADIGLDPQALDILIIAWKMKASDMCSFSRAEFCHGMQELACDTKEKLIAKVPHLRSYIASAQDFKQFYTFCFDFSKEEGQKSLPLEIAIPMWSLLLTERFSTAASDWIQFLKAEKPCKGITRDTWYLLLDFFVKVNGNYELYDENEAWPVLIDDFMGYQFSTKNKQ